MKISLNWLSEYIKLDIELSEIVEYLTDIGLEVESVTQSESIRGSLKGVVLGEIISCQKHPNADRLNITTVDIGRDDLLNIVCGAPNVRVGLKVPVATVGTILYDNENPIKIKKSKIRGEISEGMICGIDELGLGDSTDGIMELDNDAMVGVLASDYFNVENDTILDIGLTPNRSDAMGHIGVARDLNALLNFKNDEETNICLPNLDSFSVDNNDLEVTVEIEDYSLCPRYSGVSISNVKVGDSPKWLKNRLESIGVSSINNIVDITNYVLHETGHPLHAFDLSKITGNNIIVKKFKKKTKFTTLDGIDRDISVEDLMICNEKDGMCIAGVFGGLNSGVSNDTVDIFLESAYFNPTSIRRTAKRHGINTDASFRFERGSDPNTTINVLKRAALLIQDIAGGKISSKIVDVYPNVINDFEVILNYQNMDNLIGEKIPRDSIISILCDLGIKVIDSNKDRLKLKVPVFKSDVQREVDIIEEVLRIYGFNNINLPSKLNSSITNFKDSNIDSIVNKVSDLLSSNGFLEVMNNSISNSDYESIVPSLDKNSRVNIVNPLSSELNIMRNTLLFSGLENIVHNLNRKNLNLKIYEFGKIYSLVDGKYHEADRLSILLSGKIHPENWDSDDKKIDFFYLKETIELVLNRLGIDIFSSAKISTDIFSEGLEYKDGNHVLVRFGKVNRKIIVGFDIKQDVYYADFNWDNILRTISNINIKYSEISRFPSVRRDLSLLLDKEVCFDDLEVIAKKVDNQILRAINLFDVYDGKNLPEGKKSYALSFEFSDNTKTLRDVSVDKIMKKLISSYEDFGAIIRKD